MRSCWLQVPSAFIPSASQAGILVASLLSLSSLAAPAADPAALRPPAVPLVAHDPYFSIWSPADKLTDADTVHWTGKPHRLTSLVRIDGKVFRLMGKEPGNVPALPQTGLEVTPTRTVYTFQGEGVGLTLTFMTPALPDDLEVLSRPVTYLTYQSAAVDNRPHEVQIYFDASAEIAVNDKNQECGWAEEMIKGNLLSLKVGSKSQPALAKKGDDLRIDWGYLYIASPRAITLGQPGVGIPGGAARAFAANGLQFINNVMTLPEMPASALVLSVFLDAGRVSSKPVSRWLMLAYDDEYSIKYFGENLRPYWRRNGDDAAVLLKKAAADYEPLKRRCEQFDAQLLADLRKVGGEKYAQLCALAYRQTFAGNKICADTRGQPLMFPKECFSNGSISTVDVLFPQAPFFLVFSPALTKAMLVPILDYASSPRWPYPYAPHDLGIYPHALGLEYNPGGNDGDRMPVEESGNMLIMLAALARQQGDADLAKPYWPMLTKWADYLVKEGLDPTNQLCSADMFGHLPRNANLALKAIIGIGGYAQLCEKTGHPDAAKRYLAIAHDYAAKWQELARDEGRTRLAYHLPGTWSMKHNLIWDRVLGLNLFPTSVGDAEIAWYLKVQNKYGLPVDNRTDTSLIDWALWSIAPARDDADFQALLDPIWRYANETPSRVPLSDWFITTNAKQRAFQARPVVGGIFIKLLADRALWTKWSGRGSDVRGPWAPLPGGEGKKEAVPAGQSRWTAGQAWAWYKKQPWIVGFNYVPSTACNTTEFWAAETFDKQTIDRELGWGAGLGFNSCRVFVQYLVWKHDPAGLKQRLGRFLALADKHGLTTTPVLFDDCAFGDPPQTEPYLGKQRDPIPGMIAPSWTPSPGLIAVTDRSAWPELEKYIRDVVGAFGQDKRVLMWDLYNEPGNSGMGNKSLPLVEATFAWAREVNASQPLTIGPWGGTAELSRRQLELSDVISFHFYGDYNALRNQIASYKKRLRPVINTEWMARLQGSKWETDLPLFKQEAVGCYSWGLVNGRGQFQFAWWDKRGTPEPKVWFHDLFHGNGEPYDPSEHEVIRTTTTNKAINWTAADYSKPQTNDP